MKNITVKITGKWLDAGFPQRRPGFAPGMESGIYGAQSGVGVGFLQVLRLPLAKKKKHSFHQLLHHHQNYAGQLAESLRRADQPSKEYC
jgi:hypothetical protein